MQQRDVVIVGGGPAGSTLAWALRDSGLSVTVIDKREFPRDKICAGWITPAVISALALDCGDYRTQGLVLQPVHGFEVSVMGGPVVCNDHGSAPVSYGIRRFEFDAYLLARCGAELRTGEPLTSLERVAGRWLVNGELSAALVVGAGGHFCPVARTLGADLGRGELVVAAQEVEFELPPAERARCPVDGRRPRLYFCEDLAGYGWVFRKGDWLNIGLGRLDSRRLGEQVERFHAALADAGVVPAEVPRRFQGHAYLVYSAAARPLTTDGALLIGDAAGLAYPQSGEGIRPAVESALLAARAITQARGRYDGAHLGAYETALATRFGSRRAPDDSGPRPGLSGWQRRLAHALMRTHWFTRHVVLDRWFLHTQVAALGAR